MSEPATPPLRARPLLVHWLVDSIAVFVAAILVALFLGVPWWGVAAGALVLGALVAPLTHAAQIRAVDSGALEGEEGSGQA